MDRVLAAVFVLSILLSGCLSGGDTGIVEYGDDEVYMEDGELRNYSALLATHRQELRNTSSYTLEVRDSWTLFVESNATILGRNVTEVVKKKDGDAVLVRNESRWASSGRRVDESNIFGSGYRRVKTYWSPSGDNSTYVLTNSTYPGEQNTSEVSPEVPETHYPLEGQVESMTLTGTGDISYRGYNVSVLEVRVETEEAEYTGSIYVDDMGIIHKMSFQETGTDRWDHELRVTLKRVGETVLKRPAWVTGLRNPG